MARITVEDCLKYIPNRFELTMLAVKRTHQLINGSDPLVECRDKPIVTALREIASGKIGPDHFSGSSSSSSSSSY